MISADRSACEKTEAGTARSTRGRDARIGSRRGGRNYLLRHRIAVIHDDRNKKEEIRMARDYHVWRPNAVAMSNAGEHDCWRAH